MIGVDGISISVSGESSFRRIVAVLCIILGCMCAAPASALSDAAEVAWTQCYGTTGGEDGVAITTAGDGFYCALNVPQGDGELNITLTQATSVGTEIWSCQYGHAGESDAVAAIAETADGGCVLVGSTTFASVGAGSDIWVIQVDSSGDELWNLTLGGDEPDMGSDIIVLPGGGFVIIGTMYDSVTKNDVYIAEISADGAPVWEETYGGTFADSGVAIIAFPAGGYAFAASSLSKDGDVTDSDGAQDIWVGKVSSDGTLEDEWSFGTYTIDSAYDIVADETGLLYCAGRVIPAEGDVTSVYGGGDIWIFSLDDGIIGWENTYGGSGSEHPQALALRDDGELICTGSSTSSDGLLVENAGGIDIWTFAVNNSTGDLLWNVSSGGAGDDVGYSIALVDTLDLAVLGTTDAPDAGYTGYHGSTDGVVLFLEESMEITTSFSADTISGEAPFTVSFTDTSTGRGTTWLWNFGDGTTSDVQNPDHTYTESDIYTVTLTVSDGFGHTDTLTETAYITGGTAWTLPMTFSVGASESFLTAGCSHSATDGFDYGLDILSPPKAPGAVLTSWIYTPMTIGGTPFSRFSSDIRSVVDVNNLYENWSVTYDCDDPVTLSWDATALEGSPVILTLINGSESVNMRSAETYSIPGWVGAVYVNASYDTEYPVISALTPADDSCDYPAPAAVTISAEYTDNLGINTSAVVLTVNGNDVTAGSTVTGSGISYPFSAAEGSYDVLLSVPDLGGRTISTEWNFTITNETCLEIPLSPGWNMVSYPFEAAGITATFPDEAIQCFVYNATSKLYESVAIGSTTPGVGFWVASTGTSAISLSGTCLQQYDTTLPSGWSLFGSLIKPVSVSSLPPGISSASVYRYNTTRMIYEASATLEPGAAYWLSAQAGGVSLSLSL